MKLLIGTTNRGKIQEIREALSGLELQIVTPGDIGISDAPHEHGETFAENAEQKAKFYFDRSGGIPTIADDSGIVVEALNDELGTHTRRWGKGPDATDYEWIEFFLERMRSEENRRAHFHCALAYIDDAGTLRMFDGVCGGVISDELEADYLPGLPISACFKPNGHAKVFSALSVEEKNFVSHRGQALRQFRTFLAANR